MADIANTEQLVQAPPAADTPTYFDPILQGDTVEGRAFRQHQAEKKRTGKQAFTDAINNSVAAKLVRNLGQRVDTTESPLEVAGDVLMAVTGQAGRWGESTWDKSQHFDALTKDLPREYWEDVFAQDSLEGAQITRKNIDEELARLGRMGLDKGAAGAISLAGGLLDIDAPLVLASGGMVGGAKIAGKVAYAARLAGLRGTSALRAGGVVAGASGGAQAGALIGAGEAMNSDVSSWVDGVMITLTSAALGAGIGGVAPESMVPLNELRKGTFKRIAEGDEYFYAPTNTKITDEVPASMVTDIRNTPMVMDVPEQVATVDPNNPAQVAAPQEEFDIPAFTPNQGGDLSAAKAGPTPSVFPALKDPVGNMSSTTKNIINASRNYIWSTDFDLKVKAALDDAWVRASLNPMFQIGTGDVTSLWRSDSAVLRRMAATIFEIPGGQVRGAVANAANLTDMYNKRVTGHLVDVPSLMNNWAASNGKQWFTAPGINKPVGTNRAGQTEFYREVMLDMNAVSMGRPRNPDARIRAAADAYDRAGQEALEIAKGRANEIPLAGADVIAPNSHFTPYRANGQKMVKLLKDGVVTKADLIDAYKTSYMSAGTFSDPKLAGEVAKAYVDRFVARGVQLDDQLIGLFSQDGREFLRMALESKGMSRAEIDGLMSRFDADQAERGKLGTLKNRNDLDFDTPIGNTGLKIVDMMQSDFDNVYSTYARQIAGNSALARHGITSRANRKEWIEAAMAEQRALGEQPMQPELLDAMFSEFDGGPQVGYDGISGTNRGLGVVSDMKQLTSLILLPFNGLAQLAETGTAIASVGVKNWYGRGLGRIVSNDLRQNAGEGLRDLAYMMGPIGQDHHTLRLHMNLDEANEFHVGNETARAFLTRSRELLNAGNYIQGYTSLMNTVRQYQQEVAALGMMDKISRMVKDGKMEDFQLGGRIQRDLGLDPDHFDALKQLIDDGTIVFKTEQSIIGDITYVKRLNMHLWDQDLAQDFAAALNRSVNQQVQKALAGETSRWMHTVWGGALTHLQTFPILAIQKQFFRNAQSRDGQAVITALAAYGSAYTALSLRDTITGTDRDPMERAKTAFGYSNLTGWMPMYSDPVMSILGLEDMRFNTFGPYARPMSVPIVDTMNNLYRAPGAIKDVITGDNNFADNQAVRAIPFFRTVEAAIRMGTFGQVELLKSGKDAPAPTPPKEKDIPDLVGEAISPTSKIVEAVTEAVVN